MSFDWTKVEGYKEDMTPEEKLALLENYEPPADPAPVGPTVSKAQFDKVSSELAQAKKTLRAKMSADEQKEAERQESERQMKEELDALRKEKTLSSYKASYLAQGYSEELAGQAATAMVEGDMEQMFTIMKTQAVNAEKAMRAKILKETPVPPNGGDPNNELKEKREMNQLRESFGLPPLE